MNIIVKLKPLAAPLKRDLHHTAQADKSAALQTSWLRGIRSLSQFNKPRGPEYGDDC
jgi:hypothetical protein